MIILNISLVQHFHGLAGQTLTTFILSDLLKAVVTINLIPDGIILVSMPLKR
ncbi:cytotoxic necrotizing factor 1 domain protein [Yersinia pestis PY-15]|uniref:Uncharacterized protein n=1 Tax=Yersinia pestis biovar Orientalis str. IP275 TaxID=373665 RepID=A0AAV3B9B5_YERPE|nr:hypothetical protein YpAngola_A3214 [Yersinia pestis Angola]EDR30606.1 hypothetical protein YPIP275_0802 [Yersinia pestis biovar Orientalis str. IP275]EDR40950.1 hypothetical protein YpF1991016_0217 [Yersinia pestis biovar Orientalis str. F1991016]EDR41450.1 hypothetical protein YpE1979001_3246 [Yersinia pestis biovar Antiqua str. E1979001]EDR58669.1 hypothetical protein YpMG051020_0461 [Yersinia pestis biovar Orientalis str. MG05-1020]EDR59688.1 hypothetical protein YpUG050454_2981 [Yersin